MVTPTTRRITRNPRRFIHEFARPATARAAVAVFATLAAVWAVGFVDVMPREIQVVGSPALMTTFFFDALATSEFDIHETAVFHPALAIFDYLQVVAFVAAGRVLRTRLIGVGERRESGKRVEGEERK